VARRSLASWVEPTRSCRHAGNVYALQIAITYVQTQSDLLAQHMTRLADDAIQPDEIECMLFALHRAGHLDRHQLVHLQVKHLREAKP
jgi:hypothetical protein